MPIGLGGGSPRITNANEVVDEDTKVLLLKTQWAQSKIAPIFSPGLKDE
jgi:hypothetical protein